MFAHGPVREFRISAVQRSDQVAVKARRKRRTFRRDVEEPVVNQNVRLLDGVSQRRAPGAPRDMQMKLHVVGVNGKQKLTVVHRIAVAPVEHRVEMFGHAPEFAPLGSRRLLRVEARRLRLEGFADFVAFADFLRCRTANARSDTRHAFY
jgi:hypothetical protein